MKKNKEIHQGDVYMVELDGIDSEQQNVHPVIVVSNDILNKSSRNIVIFPITHQNKKSMPFHYVLNKENYPFFTYRRNIVQPECVRHISKNRLQRYIGTIFAKDLVEILKCKEYIFIEKNRSDY